MSIECEDGPDGFGDGQWKTDPPLNRRREERLKARGVLRELQCEK